MTDDNEQDTPADETPADSRPVDLPELTGSRLTPLTIEAIELHEYFCAFMAGGFTESQALQIVSNMFGAATNVVTIMSFDDIDDVDDDEDYDEDF